MLCNAPLCLCQFTIALHPKAVVQRVRNLGIATRHHASPSAPQKQPSHPSESNDQLQQPPSRGGVFTHRQLPAAWDPTDTLFIAKSFKIQKSLDEELSPSSDFGVGPAGLEPATSGL